MLIIPFSYRDLIIRTASFKVSRRASTNMRSSLSSASCLSDKTGGELREILQALRQNLASLVASLWIRSPVYGDPMSSVIPSRLM